MGRVDVSFGGPAGRELGEFRKHFSRFAERTGNRLHFAAHSHHWWPDVSFEAQAEAWRDAAERVDEKWDVVYGEVLPAVRAGIASALGLSDPGTIAFAPNTHELLKRIVSCLRGPVRILATDAEFHSFERQARRWEEAGTCRVDRVAVEPFATFADRYLEAAARGGHDLVWTSQVFYDSGFAFERFRELADVLPPDGPFLVIDGYHGFFALPTDLGPVEHRAFYLGGGYKYAMSGEGACFAHCPPGWGPRPVDTGWFAGFGALEEGVASDRVAYAENGDRFLGATFDPTALYRMRAVLELWSGLGVTVADLHARVQELQRSFLDGLEALSAGGGRAGGPLPIAPADLIPDRSFAERGHFLTFRREDAADLHRRLRERDVITDFRRDRLRIGFGVYHEEVDVAELLKRISELG